MTGKHIFAYAAIAGGALGAYNRYVAVSPTSTSTKGLATVTGTFDPAALVGLTTSETLLDAGMILDLALIALGLYILAR